MSKVPDVGFILLDFALSSNMVIGVLAFLMGGRIKLIWFKTSCCCILDNFQQKSSRLLDLMKTCLPCGM